MDTKKVLFTATVDSHILLFHIPYLKYFKEKGYKVYVATNGSEHIPFCDKKIFIPFERSPYRINNLKAIKKLKKIIDKEKFDVIHTHTPMGSVTTRLAAKKARIKYNTKVIYTAHGFHFYKGAPKLNWLLFYPVEKYLAKYTDALITINKEDYNRAKKKFKTSVYYVSGIGVSRDKFSKKLSKQEKIALRKSLNLKEEDLVVIYPAELNSGKNQTMLLKALYTIIFDNSIHILLPGLDSMNGYHKELSKQLEIDQNVHFLGFRKDIPSLLQIADIAVSTSKREGLPVNIMEDMYLGLPIVACNCRGNRDLVEDGKNGYLVEIDNTEQFRQRFIDILNIYKDKKRLEQFKKNSQKMVEPYLLDKVMIEMDKIYTEVLK